MKKKKIALLLALLLLLPVVTGCLPQIMQSIVEPYIKEKAAPPMVTEAVQEAAAGEVALLPAPTPTLPPSVQSNPAGPEEEVYSGMDYVRVYPDYPQEIDLDGDGSLETLTLLENSGSPGSEMIGITAEKNGQTYTAKVARAYLQDAFVAYNVEGRPCIVISYDYASDDYETLVYKLDGEQLVCVDQKYGFAEGVYEGVWMLRGWVYTMGTWNAYHKYTLSASFAFEPVGSDLWMLQDAGPDRMLSAKTSVDARFMDNGTLVPGRIAAGERLLPYATDQSGVVYFRMEDGRKGLLAVEVKEGYTYINGKQDDMVFDNLFYAG